MSITIPAVTGQIDITNLTDTDVNGNGVLDTLLRALRNHLNVEYELGRIRNTDYANAFIRLVEVALPSAIGLTESRAKLGLELQLLEAQVQKLAAETVVTTKQGGLIDAQIYAQMAEVEKLNQELEHKFPKEIALLDAQLKNSSIETGLKEYELQHIKPQQLALTQTQVDSATKDVALKEFELVQIKPLQVISTQKDIEILTANVENIQKDVSLKEFELSQSKPLQLLAIQKDMEIVTANVENIQKDVALKEFELAHVKPLQNQMTQANIDNLQAEVKTREYDLKNIKPLLVQKSQKEIEVATANISHINKEIALKEYELSKIRPVQLDLSKQELEVKKSQIALSNSELGLKEKQLLLAEHELTVKAPLEAKQIQMQADLYKQKVITERAQTDGSVINPDSVIAHNNKVLSEQANSYVADSKLKATGMMVDTWKIRRTDDPDEAPVNNTNNLHDINVGKAVDNLFRQVGIV